MTCAQCGADVAADATVCPSCGTPIGAPAAGDAAAFIMQRFETYRRWQSQSRVYSWPAGIVTFAAVWFALSRVIDNGTLGFILAVAAGVAVTILIDVFVVPRLAMPDIRCLYCGQRIPLGVLHGWRMVPVRKCPHCGRDLPV